MSTLMTGRLGSRMRLRVRRRKTKRWTPGTCLSRWRLARERVHSAGAQESGEWRREGPLTHLVVCRRQADQILLLKRKKTRIFRNASRSAALRRGGELAPPHGAHAHPRHLNDMSEEFHVRAGSARDRGVPRVMRSEPVLTCPE